MIKSYSNAREVRPSLLTRISYHVGSPCMLEGKRFLPETGIPIRKIACIRSPFAEAEPVPLTLASLKAKSFTREFASCIGRFQRRAGGRPTSACPRRRWDNARRRVRSARRYPHL